ncbi:hypothetical protein [Mycoplasmopsis cynos]|nr:hypothetical protein [Mycoplasmopsis cynos]MCU9935983.1 hypothetical protein [Mycoplasmopsis cynos]UWV82934.1 hypothetical protein NW067_01320 [Mycoplasmopsis cynos]UWV94214.1 hypothetical protein NW062_03025 [Mycoplasmopsis cynos]
MSNLSLGKLSNLNIIVFILGSIIPISLLDWEKSFGHFRVIFSHI